MIDIVFIKVLVRSNDKRYIFCYFILDYYGNILCNINVSYVSFFIIYFTFFESVEELYKVNLPILSKPELERTI